MVRRRFILTASKQKALPIEYSKRFSEADTSQPEYQLLSLLKHFYYLLMKSLRSNPASGQNNIFHLNQEEIFPFVINIVY